jgi:hypothetical protein
MGLLDAYPERWLPTDSLTGARLSIDYPHHEIHAGNHYTVSYSKALSAGSVLAVLITSPAIGNMHVTAGMQTSLSGTFTFSQNPSTSVGSTLTIWNNNLTSANTSGSVFIGTPSITTVGTTISTFILGTNDKQNGVGGTADSRNEFILATSTSYLLAFTANATSTYSSINVSYYVE